MAGVDGVAGVAGRAGGTCCVGRGVGMASRFWSGMAAVGGWRAGGVCGAAWDAVGGGVGGDGEAVVGREAGGGGVGNGGGAGIAEGVGEARGVTAAVGGGVARKGGVALVACGVGGSLGAVFGSRAPAPHQAEGNAVRQQTTQRCLLI